VGAVATLVRCMPPWRGLIERSVVPVVCRAEAPTLWASGRTAHLRLDETPRGLGAGGRVLKLKGLGNEEGEVPGRRAHRVAPWLARDLVPMIRADATIHFQPEETEPDGGLRLEAAEREFDAASTLHRRGVPSIEPVAVLAYQGQKFVDEYGHGHPLGVVVTLLPDGGTTRLSQGLTAFDLGAASPRAMFTSVVRRLYAVVGRLLGSFHRAGLVRHGSCLDNIGSHPSAPFLVDLDSAVMNDRVDSPALEMTRDVCEGLFSASIELVRPIRVHHPMTAAEIASVFTEFLREYERRLAGIAVARIAEYVSGIRLSLADLQPSIVNGGLAGRLLFHANRLEIAELEPLFSEVSSEIHSVIQGTVGVANRDDATL
jgi:hypothetical protein